MEPDMNNSIATEDAPYSPGQLLNEESEPVANGMFLLQLLIAQTCWDSYGVLIHFYS